MTALHHLSLAFVAVVATAASSKKPLRVIDDFPENDPPQKPRHVNVRVQAMEPGAPMPPPPPPPEGLGGLLPLKALENLVPKQQPSTANLPVVTVLKGVVEAGVHLRILK